MKKFRLLLLTMIMVAAVCPAKAREWKTARVVEASETDVSGELRGKRNIVHYTIETEEMVYFADYTYKPDQKNNSHPPEIAVNIVTKVAIEGRHVYILDANGKAVKLHIVKKVRQK